MTLIKNNTSRTRNQFYLLFSMNTLGLCLSTLIASIEQVLDRKLTYSAIHVSVCVWIRLLSYV